MPQPHVIVEPSPGAVTEPSKEEVDPPSEVAEVHEETVDEALHSKESIPQDPMPEPPLTVEDGATSYFDLPASHTIVPPQLESHPVYQDPSTNVWAGEETRSSETTPRPPLPQRDVDNIPPVAPAETNYGGFQDEIAMPSYPQAQISSKPSKESLASSIKADQGRHVVPVITQSNDDVKHKEIQYVFFSYCCMLR